VTENAVAANQLSEWLDRARDGKLVLLPAMEDDGFCFAPLVLMDENRCSMQRCPEQAIGPSS
jgi:hypothetical protein